MEYSTYEEKMYICSLTFNHKIILLTLPSWVELRQICKNSLIVIWIHKIKECSINNRHAQELYLAISRLEKYYATRKNQVVTKSGKTTILMPKSRQYYLDT